MTTESPGFRPDTQPPIHLTATTGQHVRHRTRADILTPGPEPTIIRRAIEPVSESRPEPEPEFDFGDVPAQTAAFDEWDAVAKGLAALMDSPHASRRTAHPVIHELQKRHLRWMEQAALEELSPVDFNLLLFVRARTLRFNKFAEKTPIRHFIEGVTQRRDGEQIQCPCGVRRRDTVRAGLDRLDAAGYIETNYYATKHGPMKTSFVVPLLLLRTFLARALVVDSRSNELWKNHRNLFGDGFQEQHELQQAIEAGTVSRSLARFLIEPGPGRSSRQGRV